MTKQEVKLLQSRLEASLRLLGKYKHMSAQFRKGFYEIAAKCANLSVELNTAIARNIEVKASLEAQNTKYSEDMSKAESQITSYRRRLAKYITCNQELEDTVKHLREEALLLSHKLYILQRNQEAQSRETQSHETPSLGVN